MPRVFIPTQLRSLSRGVSQLDLEAANVREAIELLDQRFPGMAKALLEEDLLARGLAVSIDGRVSPRGARTSLQNVSEVHFLPAIGGG